MTTTPTLICAADDRNRECYIQNSGGQTIYIGNSNVSTGNGYQLSNNAQLVVQVPAGETIYAIVASSTNVITILKADSD